MRQFDLDEYLKDTTQKVVTRDGRSARIVCTDVVGDEKYPILALVFDKQDDEEYALTYSKDGIFCIGSGLSPRDLFFADKEPSYRPYANADECFKDIIKHGGWIKAKSNGVLSMIVEVYDSMAGVVACIMYKSLTGEELLTEYTWADDGTPCGVKEE